MADQISPVSGPERDLVKRLRWPEGLPSPLDHPVSVKLRIEAADEIEKLRRNLRHWRDECGKLHAKLATGPDTSTVRQMNEDEVWVEVTDGTTLPGDRFSYIPNPETGVGQITSHKRRVQSPDTSPDRPQKPPCGRAGGNCQCTSINECSRAFSQQNQE